MPSKSQWDFGELFPPEQQRKVYTVSELTRQIKGMLETRFGQLWVAGEITNLRQQSSGHFYFSLKDATAQLNCVLFRGDAGAIRETLKDGLEVLACGELTVYEPRGQYQLVVRQLELRGAGALQLAFERLKKKLAAAGLFAQERKRPLPPYPRRIGLVTSPTGAAIRDVLSIIQRRNPALEIIFVPCLVQGPEAPAQIAEAIRLLNQFHAQGGKLDLILATRGGGSLEDLWAFNEEIVAYAIFESAVPVVSAVGHEIDFTISDFVADFRAPTPSAAAEIITEGVFSSRRWLAEAAARLRQRTHNRFQRHKDSWNELNNRLLRVHPKRWLADKLQLLDDLNGALLKTARNRCREHKAALEKLLLHLKALHPARQLAQWKERLTLNSSQLRKLAARKLQDKEAGLKELIGRLQLLSPENILNRGYSITRDADTGKILRDPKDVTAGKRLLTRLARGQITSIAEQPRGRSTAKDWIPHPER